MLSLIVCVILFAFCIAACLPCCLGWSKEIIAFLKGASPVLAAFIGLLALQMGISDMKDKIDARKEENLSSQNEDEEKI